MSTGNLGSLVHLMMQCGRLRKYLKKNINRITYKHSFKIFCKLINSKYLFFICDYHKHHFLSTMSDGLNLFMNDRYEHCEAR